MSGHLALELLSSYLDQEVTPRQLRLVEDHLEECSQCRKTLAGLRSVADTVRRLESVAPPSTLGMATERRIRLTSLEESRGLDIERSLGSWLRQPVLAPAFAVVLALGAILYLFSYGLAERDARSTRVVVASLPAEEAETAPSEETAGEARARKEIVGGAADERVAELDSERQAGERENDANADAGLEPAKVAESEAKLDELARRRSVAAPALADAPADTEALVRSIEGRTFVESNGIWIERGLEETLPDVLVRFGDSESGDELEPFSELGRVRLRLRERVVEVVYPE